MPEPYAIVSSRAAARLQAGHPWIYRSDVRSVDAPAGAVVRVLTERKRFLCRAFYSDRSQITLRLLTTADVPIDRSFFLQRFQAAAQRRALWVADSRCFRLVHAEGDLLPSIVIDRYADYLVLQTLSQGSEQRKAEIVNILVELFSPKGILERNDPRVRLLEGLPQSVSVLHGAVPESFAAEINGLRFLLDLRTGQKTGAFLDQRENYRAAAAYASGRALDCFTYQGGFAMSLASRCSSVEALDLSPQAVDAADRNLQLNSISNVSVRVANVFDALRELESAGQQFDTIVLDPPAFAKDRPSLPAALRGYKEINLRAMKLLSPGGYLVTCSCSHHVSEAAFLEILASAALDAKRQITVVERRTQARDFPVCLTVPETCYLKTLILHMLE
jgi:23S rRNA (cytosine1962-C5)-methyltransferase